MYVIYVNGVVQVMKERQLNGTYMPSIILEGRVTRKVGALTGLGENHRFIEMYVHDAIFGQTDADAETPSVYTTANGRKIVLPKDASGPERERVAVLFEQLFTYISNHNDFVRQFVCAAEELMNMEEEDLRHTVLLVHSKRPRSDIMDDRRTSQRSAFAVTAGHHGTMAGASEMCILCPRTHAANEKCAFIINYRHGGLATVATYHRAFDALYHVLLHPTGYIGWEDNMPLRSKRSALQSLPAGTRIDVSQLRQSSAFNPREKCTMRQYYAYRLHFRRGPVLTENCMFMSSRLFQEYACVAFWRIEAGRLNFHKQRNMNKREATVAELQQHVSQCADGQQPDKIGRISYLPDSFVGGPADMYARYLDAMAAVVHFGAPSLFVTMTANPKWDEVKRSLAYGQTANDRYDIIARVFNAKLKELLIDLEHMLGTQLARVYVIEFQKRGLPHAHIVVILAAADRAHNVNAINSLSTAELPPLPDIGDRSDLANIQRRLRALVLEHMVHNDCSGPDGRNCKCYDANKDGCSGNFPFDFCEETTLGDERQKARYRRRKGAPWTATVPCDRRKSATGTRVVTNQWIVPYNAALLLKYTCHLNVEVVTVAYAIKYLFKYLFKGSDNASAAIHQTQRILDQISHYENHRYLGAAEAFWRIFKFSPGQLTHTVVRMAVCLPDERYASLLNTCIHTALHCTLPIILR